MLGVRPDGVALYKAEVLEAVLFIGLEHHILLKGEIENETVLVPVLGNVAHIAAAAADRGLGDVLAAEGDRSGAHPVKAGETVDKLGLSVSVDTGYADDLARADGERNVVNGVALVQMARDAKTADFKNDLAGLCRGFVHLELNGAADHHVAELLLISIGGIHRADAAALSEDGDPVGNRHDLV